jgi:hypothetical protein
MKLLREHGAVVQELSVQTAIKEAEVYVDGSGM